MKKIVFFSLLMVCLPFMALAQSGNDDLYYIPKKKKTEKVQTKTVVKTEQVSVMGNGAQVATPVVIRDVNGNTRDLDEYNRRYSSRENEFTYENDTLYIQEKPYLEQGEWVNGFQGSQEDYDYAMRIIRFRSPSFAVSVSSPYYWDIISLGYSSNWNVFDTGMYAFAFPTLTNNWWWDWRYNSMFSIRYYPSNWLYRSGWYCSYDWYSWGYPYHTHHSPWHGFHPHYAHGGVGGYWGNNHGWYGSSAHNPGIHSGRYTDNYRGSSIPGRTQVNRGDRASRNDYLNNHRTSRNDQTVNRSNVGSVRNSSGRVVTSRNSTSSVRPNRSATQSRSGQAVSSGTNSAPRSTGVYTRSAQGKSSSYNRASSTRSTVNNSGSWNGGGSSGGPHYNGSSSSGGTRSGSVSSSSSRSSSSSGSFSSGGGGGGRSASSGGTSRGSSGRR